MTFRNAATLVVLLELIIAAFALYDYGYSLEGLQATTRYSGRLSLAIFSILFLLMPGNENRAMAVLSVYPFTVFAIAHGIHLIELLTYVSLTGNELIPLRLAGGFLAYVLIFGMPFARDWYTKQKISQKNYVLLETIYLYYVWFVFFMSYLPRVQGKLPDVGGAYWEFVVLLCWVCMIMGMRLASVITGRRSVNKP